jgi:hypothetical protein
MSYNVLRARLELSKPGLLQFRSQRFGGQIRSYRWKRRIHQWRKMNRESCSS